MAGYGGHCATAQAPSKTPTRAPVRTTLAQIARPPLADAQTTTHSACITRNGPLAGTDWSPPSQRRETSAPTIPAPISLPHLHHTDRSSVFYIGSVHL